MISFSYYIKLLLLIIQKKKINYNKYDNHFFDQLLFYIFFIELNQLKNAFNFIERFNEIKNKICYSLIDCLNNGNRKLDFSTKY